MPGQSTLTAGSSLSYRMKVTLQGNNIYSANPWVVEDSGYKRVMGDMTVLPNGQVVIANGIQVSSCISTLLLLLLLLSIS